MSKPTSSKNLKRPAAKPVAVKKAANVTKSKSAPAKPAAKPAAKTTAKPATKTMAKPETKAAAKPAAKAAAVPATKKPESKATAAAKVPEKVAPAKKGALTPPAPAKEAKKTPAAAATPAKSNAKKELDEKVVRGAASVNKKTDGRPGAVAIAAAKPALAPLRIEPKIIETPQPEFLQRSPDETLFTPEELDSFRVQLFTERSKILEKARKAMQQGNIQIDKNEMMDEVD